MTGFGKATVQFKNKKINIEIKSLNSKSIDLNVRMPQQYREKELELRKTVAKALTRGKIDFGLYIENTGETTNSVINTSVVNEYIAQLQTLTNAKESDLISIAMRLPDVLKTEKEEIDEAELLQIEKLTNEALQQLINFRKSEGEALEKEFQLRIDNIADLLEKIIAIDPERMEAVKEKLQKGIKDLKERVDENRWEQELIYYIEKLDITEEKVRLKKHLDYFTENLNSEVSNGKKLGFISQEMGREINTIGSKSNFAPMQQLVVQMKDELEKIKEQLLNVL